MKGCYSAAIILTIFLCSCENEKRQVIHRSPNASKFLKLEQASWVLGSWENKSDEGHLIEAWRMMNDSTYVGYSYYIIENDTVSSEKIRLQQRGNELFYIPLVKGQNQGKAINFKMTLASNDSLIFENPEHDYPQKITYVKIHSDSLCAEISGISDGKPKKDLFPMRRAIKQFD